MKIYESIKKLLYKFLVISFSSFYFATPSNGFVPYVYEPNINELEKTGISIGKTAVKIIELGQSKEAINLIELGLTLRPKDYRLWSILGEAQRQSGLLNQAGLSLKKAKELKPNKAELWFAEAAIALEAKNTKKALPLLKQGLKLDKNNSLGYFQLGNCKLMEKKFRDGLAAFKKAIEIKPDFWEALNNQGIIEFEIGQEKKAIKTWRKVLNIENNSEPMLALAAALNIFNPENRESLKLAKEALRKNPNYVSSDHQKEQLWGNRLIEATKELLSHPQLTKDVDQALANSNLKN